MKTEIRQIHKNFGIILSAGNYVVIREVLFNVGKPNEYLKDMPVGYYGTFEQAVIGLRRNVLKNGEDDEVAETEQSESIKSLDDFLEKLKNVDTDIKLSLDNNKLTILNMYQAVKDGVRIKSDTEEADEETSL